jgi:hypothetical protein
MFLLVLLLQAPWFLPLVKSTKQCNIESVESPIFNRRGTQWSEDAHHETHIEPERPSPTVF